MKKTYPLVIDVETQHSFQEVNHNLAKLKVSLVGSYDYGKKLYRSFREDDLTSLFNLMEHASFLIGFNIRKFDLPVLAPYYLGKTQQFEVVDLLELVEQSLGFRVALDDLARSTLGTKKSGHGFSAINFFRQGDWQSLEKYCLDDVRITKDLYDYVKKEGKFIFRTPHGPKEVPINLSKKSPKKKPVSLSLPF